MSKIIEYRKAEIEEELREAIGEYCRVPYHYNKDGSISSGDIKKMIDYIEW